MSSDDSKMNRKKVALNVPTYDKLKDFSRYNGLKLRLVLDAMTDVVLQDEALSKRIVDMTLENQSDEVA